jgi:hypothetical protein
VALVIPRSKVVDLGGGQAGLRVTLRQEINAQSLEDVRTILRETTLRDTQQQINIGNPPQLAEVDGLSGKQVTQAEKRTVVIFGATLAAAAMRLVESALANAIARTTTARSGALSDITGHWQWQLVTKGGSRRVTSANPPAALAISDRLILMPQGVPYTTNVNQAVDHKLVRNNQSISRAGTLVRRRKVKAKGKGPDGPGGFLEAAAASLKSRSDFKQFLVYVAFTKRHKVPGEKSQRYGSPMIVIRPRLLAGRRKG